jgi:hypothetical protein
MFHCCTAVIANIQDMMNWEVILAHSREENFSAYFLTKLGLTNNDRLIIWESPPKNLKKILLVDALRVIPLRV